MNAALAGASNPFAALMQQSHLGVVLTDADGRIARVNRRWAEILGYSEAELVGLTIKDVTHAESMRPTTERLSRLAAGESHYVLEKKYVRKDGSSFWASATVCAIRDGAGNLEGYIALVSDLSPQRRARRLVESQNEALEMIIKNTPIERIFERLISVVEEEAEGDAVGAILLLESGTGKLRHGAAPGLPDHYNRAVDGIKMDPEVGTCAAAAACKKVVITPDIETAPGWAHLKQLPLGLGLRSAWSMPIMSSTGDVLGTFGTYFRVKRRPTDTEVGMVSMLAKTAALAIERAR